MIEFNWGKSIFPVFSCEFDSDDNPRSPKFLGTAFHTVIEGNPLLVSARHVLGGFERTEAEPCIATRFGSEDYVRLHGPLVEHQAVDVAFLLLTQDLYGRLKPEIVPIPIAGVPLGLGSEVFTQGFPNSAAILDPETGGLVLEIDQFFFKGHVCNILDTTSTGGTKKSYLVSFPAMPGASGSPLLLVQGKKVVCVGFIFQERSIRHNVDETRISVGAETVSLPVFQTYTFGVACDTSPLLELGNMLRDFRQSKGDKA